ncbi:GNAT family N-acetyltransferase, partial [Streptomyces sp. NPDC060188]
MTLDRGEAVTVQRADAADLPEARALHERCSPETLARRHRGPDPLQQTVDVSFAPNLGSTKRMRST